VGKIGRLLADNDLAKSDVGKVSRLLANNDLAKGDVGKYRLVDFYLANNDWLRVMWVRLVDFWQIMT
jgi:hypothetical protein